MTDKPQLDTEFIQVLTGEDELGIVIRAHTHIEASLNELLELMVPYPKFIDEMNLPYAQKARLACALGVKKQHLPPLLVMGKLRNTFAHSLNAKLTKERVDELYNCLSKDDRTVVHMSYERTKTQMLRERGPDFRKLDPRDQFILMAVSLKALIVIAVREIRGRGDAQPLVAEAEP